MMSMISVILPRAGVAADRIAGCKGCGICAAFCPKQALELVDEKVRLKEDGECVLCGMCEMRCPDYAIYIEEETGGANQWVI